MSERDKYRKILIGMSPKSEAYELTKMTETLHKFLACSYYGVTGYENFRLYSDPVRKAITFLGRKAMEIFRQDCRKAGYEVLYGDTDSIFVQLRTDMPGEGRIIEAVVNESLKRMAWRRGATFFVEAKYEMYCRRIIFVPKFTRRRGKIIAAKKRYAWTDKDNNLYVVGLAPRRSSTPKLTRRLMLRWLELVLQKKQVEGAKLLIRAAWIGLESAPANEIGQPRGLGQKYYKARNPWQDGCKYMTERFHVVFREDKKPLLIWMKGRRTTPKRKKLTGQMKTLRDKVERERRSRGLPAFKENTLNTLERGCDTDVICVTERDEKIPEELLPYVDWVKMRDRVLRNHFEPLFNAIGVTWEEVIERKRKPKFKGHTTAYFKVKGKAVKRKETKAMELSKWS